MTRAPRKIVVTGPFGAGKTTFAATLTPGGPGGALTTTETAVSDATATLKSSTTVAMDHTTVEVTPPEGADWATTRVSLFGTPGQLRFRFMWEVLAQNLDGYLVLVDASRGQSIAEAAEIVTAFAQLAPEAPRLVAVSRWADPAGTRDQLAHALGTSPRALVACDPRDPVDCLTVLRVLVDGVWTLHSRRHAAPAPGPTLGDRP